MTYENHYGKNSSSEKIKFKLTNNPLSIQPFENMDVIRTMAAYQIMHSILGVKDLERLFLKDSVMMASNDSFETVIYTQNDAHFLLIARSLMKKHYFIDLEYVVSNKRSALLKRCGNCVNKDYLLEGCSLCADVEGGSYNQLLPTEAYNANNSEVDDDDDE